MNQLELEYARKKKGKSKEDMLSLIHISEPTRLL